MTDRDAAGGGRRPRAGDGHEAHEMVVTHDVAVVMDDGVTLRADVFLPVAPGPCPVILSSGPYAKGLSYRTGRKEAWEELVAAHPELLERSSNRHQCWEMPDPERFVPHGYACVRVDTRGTGRSEGVLDPLSPREVRDLYECVEWAGTAPFSNGRVGLLGVSYLAINQWLVAAMNPPHLAAICPWEGGADCYRDLTHHGGILSSFWASWYERRVLPVQHGVGDRGPRSEVTGETVAGPETLDDASLASLRTDFPAEVRAHRLDDEFHRVRTPDFSKIEVPVLSSANWGGAGLHSRGNFEGFTQAASAHKWLEVHGGSHFEEFSTDYGVALQLGFFDRFLRDGDAPAADATGRRFGDGWRVKLQVRRVDGFTERCEQAWPLPGTRFTRSYLDPAAGALVEEVPAARSIATYDSLGPGLTFLGRAAPAETEVTGPVAARLFVSTTARDADLFLVLRLFDPDLDEVVFRGAQDHGAPVAQGWLRLSHRGIDPERSLPWRPYHRHDGLDPVEPGEVVEVEVELWPTSIVVPPGYRLGLSVRGRDYQRVEPAGARGVAVEVMNGSGRCVHDDPVDRDEAVLDGTVTVYGGADRPSHVLLPVVG